MFSENLGDRIEESRDSNIIEPCVPSSEKLSTMSDEELNEDIEKTQTECDESLVRLEESRKQLEKEYKWGFEAVDNLDRYSSEEWPEEKKSKFKELVESWNDGLSASRARLSKIRSLVRKEQQIREQK